LRRCFFVTDLHGHADRYEKLLAAIAAERPSAVFVGGDLLPHGLARLAAQRLPVHDFFADFLLPRVSALRAELGEAWPAIFLILGNDDPRREEAEFRAAAERGLWHYIHQRKVPWEAYAVYGYAYVPPSPFRLKDWERYDVSRYVDPGCVSPEEGVRTVPVTESEARFTTIARDLQDLTGDDSLVDAIVLAHTPPHDTALDRAALDGQKVEGVPLDLHVGSIALRRFIEARQPLLTLHGHVHESARLTGTWRTRIGRTHAFNAAHDGPELALVRFDPAALEDATRELL
jgi:Icc-related predicted phosphoesterase